MKSDLGSSSDTPFGGLAETASITLDIGELWYLHEAAAEQLMADCEHGQVALETTLLLEEAIVCCEDNSEEEASIQLRAPEIALLLGLVRRSDKDATGRPVGLEVARRLMRARLLLHLGQLPVAAESDLSYAEASQDRDGGDA